MSGRLAILLAASLLDRIFGDPDWLWRRAPHPVALIGHTISALERRLNDPRRSDERRRLNGFLAIAVLVGASLLAGLLLHRLFASLGFPGLALEAVAVAVLLAGKSLIDHVERVAIALEGQGIEAGRRAVSLIVGRDPERLDAAGVCRAAVESLAENASDGFVAPWAFYLVFGLPGLLAYKAVNTADSMIGHLNERYRAFGFASARLDDFANWLPARLTALLFALAAFLRHGGAAGSRALRAARRDAPLHRSPNAGWPEAAVAGALDLALGGPRRYGDLVVDAPMLYPEGRREASVADIRAALALFRTLSLLLICALALALVPLAL